MAWTTTKENDFVYGNHRGEVWKVEPDSGTVTALSTGLKRIVHHSIQILTATGTSTFGVANVGASSTAIGGVISFQSASNGGDFRVTVYGG